MNILDVLYQPWAIAPDRLMEIQSIYAAHLRGESIDIDAVEARIGRQLQNQPQGYQVQDGAALIPLRGVMAPRMNLMSQVSGGTSTELFARDVKAALNDPAVQSIVLLVDSPGGAVGGTMAAASAVMAARGVKPIATYSEIEPIPANGQQWQSLLSNLIKAYANNVLINRERLLNQR